MFDFKNKVAVVTGGACGIGKCISEKFHEAGADVCVIDLLPNNYFEGDLANKETLERFAEKVIADFGHVDYLINNAPPLFKGCVSTPRSPLLGYGERAAPRTRRPRGPPRR